MQRYATLGIGYKWGTKIMEALMTIEDVAAFLNLSRDTVYRMVQTGKLPASKVGTQWRFRRIELEEWLERNKNTATASGKTRGRRR